MVVSYSMFDIMRYDCIAAAGKVINFQIFNSKMDKTANVCVCLCVFNEAAESIII